MFFVVGRVHRPTTDFDKTTKQIFSPFEEHFTSDLIVIINGLDLGPAIYYERHLAWLLFQSVVFGKNVVASLLL